MTQYENAARIGALDVFWISEGSFLRLSHRPLLLTICGNLLGVFYELHVALLDRAHRAYLVIKFLVRHYQMAAATVGAVTKRKLRALAVWTNAQMDHHVVGVVECHSGQTWDSLLKRIGEADVRLVGMKQKPATIRDNIERLLELEECAGIGDCLEYPFEPPRL